MVTRNSPTGRSEPSSKATPTTELAKRIATLNQRARELNLQSEELHRAVEDAHQRAEEIHRLTDKLPTPVPKRRAK
jgi:ABC-type transporter Mla subunit MlaD